MIRQCFFPTSYKRPSKNLIHATCPKQKETLVTQSFVRRLDLSCRRPAHSEKHKRSFHESENLETGEDEVNDTQTLFPRTIKSNQFKIKSEQEQLMKKKLFLLPEKKQIRHTKELKKKSEFHMLTSKSRRFGITEIKNEEWNWKPKSQRINMTQKVKTRKGKQQENVIIGWDYLEESDNFF